MPERPLPRELWGRDLRCALLSLLLRGGVWSVSDLVVALEERGFVVPAGKPAKVVADALAHEVLKGRAVRHARGMYGAGAVAERTRQRISARARTRPERRATSTGWPAGSLTTGCTPTPSRI